MDPLTRYYWNRAGTEPGRTIMLLMYHGTPPASRPTSQYDIGARRFRQHLDLLQKAGWQTVRVSDLVGGELSQNKTVVLTLDDGYANNYAGAFKPLVERGMVATWFVVSNLIGKQATWKRRDSNPEPLFSASQLRELAAAGMEIGSHSCSHPDLSRESPDKVVRELVESRKTLEDLLGQEITSFAYPYGFFNEDTVRLTAECGYKTACTARAGWHKSDQDPMTLRRVTVFSRDTPATLARKIAFADNEFGWGRFIGYMVGRLTARIAGKRSREYVG